MFIVDFSKELLREVIFLTLTKNTSAKRKHLWNNNQTVSEAASEIIVTFISPYIFHLSVGLPMAWICYGLRNGSVEDVRQDELTNYYWGFAESKVWWFKELHLSIILFS